tara:strand:+ start:3258 stop:4844 length:1587 start_codon:yes stop_codon:yes gene_type:complete
MNILESLDIIGSSAQEHVAPGAFTVKKATLHHGPGSEYAIGGLIKQILLFEDIETVGVTGYIDLHDNVNLFQGGPLIGHELLYLNFETAGATEAGIPEFGIDFSIHPLFVYKVDNMTTGNMGPGPMAWLDYRLHFCSPELLRNNRIRLSKTYQGNIDKIVTNILKDEIKTIKPIEASKTIDIHQYIAPSIRPYDFISELVPKAQKNPDKKKAGKGAPKGKRKSMSETVRENTTETGSAGVFKGRKTDFMFYETSCRADATGGFKFLPAITLKSTIPETTFTLSNTKDTLGVPGIDKQAKGGYAIAMLTSQSYIYKFLGDKFQTISTGLWAATHIRHNSYNKSFDVYKHDYQKQLEHDRFSLVSKTFDYMDDRPITEYPDAKVRYSSSQGPKSMSNINTSTRRANYPYSITTPSGDLLRMVNMGHIFGSHRLEFTLPGVSGISVGSMCFANIPDIGFAAGQPGLDGARQLWENRLDNTWIVTKVAHRLVVQGESPTYTTKVEIANTMTATSQVLKNYGQLGGAGYSDVG